MSSDRAVRAENYAVKRGHGFQCSRCNTGDQVLVVVEKRSGELTTVCDRHLDRRIHEVRPHQWDEAERLRAELEKKGK